MMNARLNADFGEAIALYVDASFEVQCEEYGAFGSGMNLDYERKFAYLK